MSRFLSRGVLWLTLLALVGGLAACTVYETPSPYYRPAYSYGYAPPPPAAFVYEPGPAYYAPHHHHHHDWR